VKESITNYQFVSAGGLYLSAMLLLVVPGVAHTSDRIIGNDAIAVASFDVPYGLTQGNISPMVGNLQAGFYPISGQQAGGRSVSGHAIFRLPQVQPPRVRSATLQIVRNKGEQRCSGAEPVLIDLYAYISDGKLDLSDVGRGQRIHRSEGTCVDSSFSEPLDVSAAVRTAIATGGKFIGFSLRAGNTRRAYGLVAFNGNNPAIRDANRVRLLVTVADDDVAAVESASPALTAAGSAAQAGPPGVVSGIAGALSNLMHGGGTQSKQGVPAVTSNERQAASVPPSANTSSPAGATPSAADANIVGLRLGVSPAEVREAIGKHDKTMKIMEQQGGLKDLPGVAFLSKVVASLDRRLPVGPVDEIGVHFPPPPHKPQAIFINRSTGFDESGMPLITAIKDALIEKYGPPSFSRDAGADVYMTWAFTPAGAQMIDDAVERRCPRMGLSHPANTANVFFVDLKSDGCGLTILARMSRNSTGQGAFGPLARYLSVSMIDASGFPQMRSATRSYMDSKVHDSASKVKGPKL
jgi:hypothetical protein